MQKELLKKILKQKHLIPIFKNVEDNIIKQLVKDIRFLQYNPNETIIEIGASDKDIFLLLKGECKVFVEKDKLVGTIKEQQVFGEFALITNTFRSATVIATVPTTVIAFNIDNTTLERETRGYAVLYKNFTNELIEKLNLTNYKTREGKL